MINIKTKLQKKIVKTLNKNYKTHSQSQYNRIFKRVIHDEISQAGEDFLRMSQSQGFKSKLVLSSIGEFEEEQEVEKLENSRIDFSILETIENWKDQNQRCYKAYDDFERTCRKIRKRICKRNR